MHSSRVLTIVFEVPSKKNISIHFLSHSTLKSVKASQKGQLFQTEPKIRTFILRLRYEIQKENLHFSSLFLSAKSKQRYSANSLDEVLSALASLLPSVFCFSTGGITVYEIHSGRFWKSSMYGKGISQKRSVILSLKASACVHIKICFRRFKTFGECKRHIVIFLEIDLSQNVPRITMSIYIVIDFQGRFRKCFPWHARSFFLLYQRAVEIR